MRKKNLPAQFQNLGLSFDFAIIPQSLDLKKKWFIRAFGRRMCRNVPNEKEFALRIEAAKQILFDIEKDFKEPKTQKYFAKDVNILYACLESKKDIRKKTFETYKSILQNLDNYAKKLNINTLQRVKPIKLRILWNQKYSLSCVIFCFFRRMALKNEA